MFVAMAARFNIWPTVVTLVMVFPCVALMMYIFFPEPLYYLDRAWFSIMTWDYDAHQRSTFDSVWPHDRSFFVFGPYGTIVMLLVLWLWNPLGTYWRTEPKIWFDKYCVSQSDKEKNIATLLRMPYYLKHTKELFCVFDEQYCNRLWCIFELSVYLKMRQAPIAIFANTSQKMIEMILVSWRIFSVLIGLLVTRFACSSLNPADAQKGTSVAYLWYRVFDLGAIQTAAFLLGQRWFKDSHRLREAIRTYDVRKAELSVASDRLLLLQYIHHYWGEDGVES